MSSIVITTNGHIRISDDYIKGLYRAALDAGIRNKDLVLREIINYIILEIEDLITAGDVPTEHYDSLCSQVRIYVTILIDELTDINSIKPLENYKFPDDMTIH